jgi:hypothetical protein
VYILNILYTFLLIPIDYRIDFLMPLLHYLTPLSVPFSLPLYSYTLKMAAVRPSETSVAMERNTGRHAPDKN